MATYTVTTDQNFTAISGFADYDRINIDEGATLTINTDTDVIEQIIIDSLGTCLVENTSTTTPIFIDTGSNDTAVSTLRFEAAGKLDVNGDWIELGTSDGTADQTFATPQNAASDPIEWLPVVFVFEVGETEPVLYMRVDSLTDALGDDVGGRVFTYTEASETVTFGDGTEGYAPPNGAVIKIPNIFFFDQSTTRYTQFDLGNTGTIELDKVIFGQNYWPHFGSAIKTDLRNVGIDLTQNVLNMSSQFGAYMKNFGILADHTTNGGIYATGLNDFEMDNVNVYSTQTGSIQHGFYLVNGTNGLIKNCTVWAPDVNSSSVRAAYYATSKNLRYENCNALTVSTGWYLYTGNIEIVNCKYNGAAKRNSTTKPIYGMQAVNTNDVYIENLSSLLLDDADGAIAPDTYWMIISTGTERFTVTDCDLYVGDSTTLTRTNSPFYFNGTNHRVNDIRVHGEPSNDTVNLGTSAASLELYNIKFLTDAGTSSDVEWSDNTAMDLVSSPDGLEAGPTFTGKNTISCGIRLNETDTGRIYKPMCQQAPGYFNEISVTGNYYFDNVGRFYMDTAGDEVEFLTDVHYGVTGFNGTGTQGGGASNFVRTVAMRKKDGVWTSFLTLNTTNLQTQFASLTDYSHEDGIQLKFRLNRFSSNLVDFIYNVYVGTTLEPGYERPFVVEPVDVTLTVLDVDTGLPIEDARVYLELNTGGPGTAGTELLNTLTDSSGQVLISGYDYQGDQPIIGRVRKASASPYYKTADIVNTITENGLTASIFMLRD